MKKNHFLKLTSFILSVSTLVSSLSVAPSRAQAGVSLSKEAKIGISAAAGLLFAGLITGGVWLHHNRRENISADEPGEKPDTPQTAWEVLESKLRENKSEDEAEAVIDWVSQNYEKLKEYLSVPRSNDEPLVFRIDGGGVKFTIQHAQNPETAPQLKVIAEKLSKVYSLVKQSSSGAGAIRLPKIIFSDDEYRELSRNLGNVSYIRRYAIKQYLESRAIGLQFHKDPVTGKKFYNNWQQLCYLLGSEENISYVENNYPEWQKRLTGELFGDSGRHYETIYNTDYESFALMSIAYSLLLAKAEKYDAGNSKNNEIITREKLKYHDPNFDESKTTERLNKVKVLEEDILGCAHNHFAEWGLQNKKIGFLNAGDPYEPNGFLPNHGSALEEYLSMNTTLIRDLSHKAFRKGTPDCQKGGFYTTREKFPPVGTWNSTEGAWGKLTGPERDFYHERGIMSRHVRLIRPLGNHVWYYPKQHFSNFDVGSGGLYDKEFCVLNIVGLEDRSGTLVKNPVYQGKWKEITKKQCRFVLEAFINEGVKVLFLCAFGGGCFGGSASIVAECFRELLIDEGYADYFDLVVFPIIGGLDPLNGGLGNIAAFNAAFSEDYKTRFVVPATA